MRRGAGVREVDTAAGSAESQSGALPGGPGGGANSTASQITAWVAANFTPKTVGGVTVYDLTQPTAAAGS